jgi:hypothetical protein
MLLQSLLRPVLTPIMRGIFDPALCVSAAWSPLSLWPDGIASPGMWISPRDLTSEWADYTGTTPVVTPGTVADSSNPVGLALDIRAGAPEALGPELVVNGDFSDGSTDWHGSNAATTLSVVSGSLRVTTDGSILNAGVTQSVSGLTAGKTYQYLFRIATISNPSTAVYPTPDCGLSGVDGYFVSGEKRFVFTATGTTFTVHTRFAASAEVSGDYFELDNISVREVPGNHMLQSTSVDRPLLSARVNLLTYTEDFSNAIWIKRGAVSVTPNAITAPDGTLTADLISGIGATGVDDFYSVAPAIPQATGASLSLSFYVDKGASSGVLDVQAVAGPGGGHWTISLSSVASGWDRITDAHPAVTVLVPFTVVSPAVNSGPLFSASSGGPLSLYMWGCQIQLASAASDYQAILTDGSSYSSTGFPIAQLYDGVDDGMATAAFTAGTLIDGMDCMIAVRRDSAAACVAGLYNGIADATKFFGMAESASGSGCVGSGAGTPTVWVDNAQLTGGTAVTRARCTLR